MPPEVTQSRTGGNMLPGPTAPTTSSESTMVPSGARSLPVPMLSGVMGGVFAKAGQLVTRGTSRSLPKAWPPLRTLQAWGLGVHCCRDRCAIPESVRGLIGDCGPSNWVIWVGLIKRPFTKTWAECRKTGRRLKPTRGLREGQAFQNLPQRL